MITLEAHLAAHRHLLGMGRCSCGFLDRDALTTIAGVQAAHEAHVAATWQEARTVRAVEQLEALPVDAMLRKRDGGYDDAGEALDDIDRWAEEAEEILPALVVWSPEGGAA